MTQTPLQPATRERRTRPEGTDRGAPAPIRAPWTSQKRAMAWTVGIFLTLVPISLWQIGFSPGNLADGWSASESFRSRVLPPDFADADQYLGAMVETIAMVLVATFIATLLSIPVAFLAATNTTTGRGVQAVARGSIVVWRAIPDIVLAIIFRLLVGIGPLAGVIAMALHSIGMLGKLFADAIEEIDEGPRQALEAQGATRLQIYATAVLPQVMSAWIGAILYRFDINIRTSVLLGFVGAGGIGTLLRQQQGQLVWDRVIATALVIFASIVVLEQLSTLIRRSLLGDEQAGRVQRDRVRVGVDVAGMLAGGRPVAQPWDAGRRKRWGYGIAAAVLVAGGFGYIASVPLAFNWEGFLNFWRGATPDFTDRWEIVLSGLAESLWIAVAAAFVGILISIPFGLLGARNASPNPWVHRLARSAMLVNRGIPEVVLAVFFVVLLGGLGPVAGFLTLAVGAIGFTGKLMADQIEDRVARGPTMALDSVGASWAQRTSTGVWPQAVPGFVATSLYTFDVMFRSSTVLGIVGAGGIGATLFQAFSGFDYPRMTAIIIEIFIVVLLVEQLAGYLRRKLI